MIYYRGWIDFCNFACSYCPFAKHPPSPKMMALEEKTLQNLQSLIQSTPGEVFVMMTPYGEGMVHSFYQQAVADLLSSDKVAGLGVQTNFSWNVEEFLSRAKKGLEKLRIWATYHPEFSSVEHFAQKINKASERFAISAGIVATTENQKEIQNLRSALNPDVYLWLNAMDRQKHRFDENRIEELLRIDPMFSYEFAAYRDERSKNDADFAICCSYENCYVEKNKASNRCFFKSKQAIASDCHNHRLCDCYLGYSNFKPYKMVNFFGEGLPFRVPKKRKVQAIFIDIDGVMTSKNGRLLPDLETVLRELSDCGKLYVATARNLESAKKKLNKHWRFFAGGIFSDGALVLDFEKEFERYYAIDEAADVFCDLRRDLDLQITEENRISLLENKIRKDRYKTHLLRLQMPTGLGKKVQTEQCQRRFFAAKCFLQHPKANKWQGIQDLMALNDWQNEELLFISDNPQDDCVFEHLRYTATPFHSRKSVNRSFYILELFQLLLVLEKWRD